MQSSVAWLTFVESHVEPICGPGAQLRVLAAFEGDRPVAAVPMVRTSPAAGPRPFPMDVEDLFFGLWMRNLAAGDAEARLRVGLSGLFGRVLGALNGSLGRALVLHAPLSPVSEPLVAPDVPPEEACRALQALVARAREIAGAEGRCLLLPRVPARLSRSLAPALHGFTRVTGYSSAYLTPSAPLVRGPQQNVRRNTRLMERLGVAVEIRGEAPGDVPFGVLFQRTAGRHRDPAPRLGDTFFRHLAQSFAGRVSFLIARRAGRPLGFLAVLDHGATWEAFKCGTDREAAGQAPVYLDLIYGRLRAAAAARGVARLDVGPGDLEVKRRYGAALEAMESFLALPRAFRGERVFGAYLRALGRGIAQVESAAATPK